MFSRLATITRYVDTRKITIREWAAVARGTARVSIWFQVGSRFALKSENIRDVVVHVLQRGGVWFLHVRMGDESLDLPDGWARLAVARAAAEAWLERHEVGALRGQRNTEAADGAAAPSPASVTVGEHHVLARLRR